MIPYTLGPDAMIEVGTAQQRKFGEHACGDTIRTRRISDEERSLVVLSDGLGSGIKAGVLSTLTATMAVQYAAADIGGERAADTILRTLPECSVRRIRYATFTSVDAHLDGACRITHYDNPFPIVVRRDEHRCFAAEHPEFAAVALHHAPDSRRTASAVSSRLRIGDCVFLLSDGVTQSGMGSARYPFGWGSANVAGWLCDTLTARPHLSAGELASAVVSAALSNDVGRAKDDISCAVVSFRRPRRLLIATGPPIDPTRDAIVAQALARFPGRTVVAGGTTANLVARELNRAVRVELGSFDRSVPPISSMEGVTLVTEGTITIARVAALLESGAPQSPLERNGATMLRELLLDSDEIHFLVGTKINEAHQCPGVPVELEIRRSMIKRIARCLQERYLKRTEVTFV